MKRIFLVLFFFTTLWPLTSYAQGWSIDRYQIEGRMSGYLFLGDQTKALQDDDFLNPGIFSVERGAKLWSTVDEFSGKSCETCHGNATESMVGIAANLPKYDYQSNGIINLELLINRERIQKMNAEAYKYESQELLDLTSFITYQSRGLPRNIDISGPAQSLFNKGKEHFMTRRGQLDLACSQCHDERFGLMLRGDKMSQGQTNGFPFYRLIWRSMGSTHRMFAWCNDAMRADPYPLGSEEYLNLEIYVAWRGRGLPIETPAVRR